MKLLFTIFAALLLLAVESAATRAFGFGLARPDVAVAVVLFLGLRTQTLEGAVGSFFAGYFVDVLSGQPSGLYAFTAMVLFLVARLVAPFADVRSAVGFALLALGLDVLHNLVAFVLVSLASPEGISRTVLLSGIPASAVLTALAAMPIWLLLRRIEMLFARPETGLLR